MKDFSQELETAKKIIRSAGEKLLVYSDKPIAETKTKENIYSIVTQADIETEQYIKKNLESIFPSYGIIGEEGSENLKETAWIVDPIDGTAAFARNHPEYGVAISLKHLDEIIFGLHYIPSANALYFAYKDKGAYKNDSTVQVSTVSSIDKALLSINQWNLWTEEYKDYSLKVISKCHNFRVGFSSVYECSYLAEGKTDLTLRFNQPIWDVASQYILMKEAGAVISDWYGTPLQLQFSKEGRHNYIATNKYLHDSAKELLYLQS